MASILQTQNQNVQNVQNVQNHPNQNQHQNLSRSQKTESSILEDQISRARLDFQTRKEAFIRANHEYGYNGRISEIRAKEFAHMEGVTYLDHTGATTYAYSPLISYQTDLATTLFGNPHSENPSSRRATAQVDHARRRVLDLFRASPDNWDLIFTQNASGAAKIVADSFQWEEGSEYIYYRETHTSMVGIRGSVQNFPGTIVKMVDRKDVEDMLSSGWEGDDDSIDLSKRPPSIFSYPAQSNFNGTRFPLGWIRRMRSHPRYAHFKIFLDAAAYLATGRLDLSDTEAAPDFLCLSFYKLFGFPTGLGALLVRRPAAPFLHKNGFFGGGTVRLTAVSDPWVTFRHPLNERFEDGTINFLSIIALNHAIPSWERIFGDPFSNAMSKHCATLTAYLYAEMQELRHWNGKPLCVIYCDSMTAVWDSQRQGPIVNFNMKRPDGTWVEFDKVEKLAGDCGVHLRAGSFCNPGAATKHFNITTEQLKEFDHHGYLCSDFHLVGGNPLGSIRASLGAMSTIDDVLRFLSFLRENFLQALPRRTHSLAKGTESPSTTRSPKSRIANIARQDYI